MNQEKAPPIDTAKKFTETDMLEAFRHGRNYEPCESKDDINTASLPEKNRPFWGWLNLRNKRIQYKHKFSLRVGEIAKVNGIPCEYLGMGNFGTNTYPGKPKRVKCRMTTNNYKIER